jgi:hypothetical protein
MAKFLLSALFFWFHLFVTTPAFASEEPGNPEKISRLTEVCDAPAPDSFRITSIGGSFMTLAWKPAWEGATHVLYISQKDSSGGWTAQSVLPNVSGNTITVNGLIGGKEYRFRIATKCSSGDPSEFSSIVDGIALIVELTLLGRNPKNPQQISCTDIDHTKHPWLGFRVAGNGASNLFEVNIHGVQEKPFASIRRVETVNPIVAVDDVLLFPNAFDPIIEDVRVPFLIRNLNIDPTKNIGWVEIVITSTNPLEFDMCKVLNDPQKPWDNGYDFTVIKASETIKIPSGGGTGQGFGQDPKENWFEVQNPFSSNINIFIPHHSNIEGSVTVMLFNSNGQNILNQKIDMLDSQISLPTQWLKQGIYFLQIESNREVWQTKLIKS